MLFMSRVAIRALLIADAVKIKLMPKKILIVEDDPVARQIMHQLLKSKYEVFVSGDAMAGLIEARNRKPDLIILDLGLPAGGGLTLLQRVKAIPALSVIPVLIVSGMDKKENEPKALAAGADSYLQKTPTNDQLLTRIQELIGE
jgi:two-component system KDP operon response regulator KdpE